MSSLGVNGGQRFSLWVENCWCSLRHNWSVQLPRTLCKKPFWINIHDVRVNRMTVWKQVKRVITVIPLATNSIFLSASLANPRKKATFVLCMSVSFSLSPVFSSLYSPHFMCCFYPYLIVHVKEPLGPQDCIIRTCHILSGGVNQERLRRATSRRKW